MFWAAFKTLPFVVKLKIVALFFAAASLVVSGAYLAGRMIEAGKCKTRAQSAAIEKGIEKNEIRNLRPDLRKLSDGMRAGRL